jgi:hypothetical protein
MENCPCLKVFNSLISDLDQNAILLLPLHLMVDRQHEYESCEKKIV